MLIPVLLRKYQEHSDLSKEDQLNHTVEALVRYQMIKVIKNSELLQKAKSDGKLQVMGAVYEVKTGKVRLLN